MLESLQASYPILGTEFINNPILTWLIAIIVFLSALGALKLLRTVVVARLKKLLAKTKTRIDDIIINSIDAIYWPFYVVASLYLAVQFVNLPGIVERGAFYVFLAAVVYYAVKFFAAFIDFGAQTLIEKKEGGEENAGIIKLLGTLVKIILWAGAIVLFMSNLGINVTSLIAGLGIGGIAIALAVQNILGDLFNSLAIYFDKPFQIGDFVIVGEQMGTIKKVGIKTTRIQALQGEEIVVSNSDLMGARIQNFGVMQKRRIVFTVGVTYQTPAEKLRQVPDMIKGIISQQEQAEVDRAHFKSFGDSALVYEVVYYVLTGDYNRYMDTQQAINLGIVNKFESEGISIAYPTQTVYVSKHE